MNHIKATNFGWCIGLGFQERLIKSENVVEFKQDYQDSFIERITKFGNIQLRFFTTNKISRYSLKKYLGI